MSLYERRFPVSLSAKGRRRPEKYYSVEEGTVGWKATEPTTISEVEVQSSGTIVQEYVAYTLRFRPDIEVEAGAHVLVQFPTGGVYSFDNKLNSMSTMGGLFGSRRDAVKFDVEAANLKIETREGTARHNLPSLAEMSVQMIKNPDYVGTFGSFSIKIFDKYKELIAEVTKGVTYSTTSGGILAVKIWPENKLVDSQSKLQLEFAPLHAVKKNSKLRIEITDEITIPCPEKFAYASAQFASSPAIACKAAPGYTVLTVDKPYVNDYSYSEGEVLQVVFLGTLPYSARSITKIRLTTLTAAG